MSPFNKKKLTKKQIKVWSLKYKRAIIEVGAVVLLFIIASAGSLKISTAASLKTGNQTFSAIEIIEQVTATPSVAKAAEVPGIDLSEEEKALLDQLCELLNQRQLADAASLLTDHEIMLQDLFYNKLQTNYNIYSDGVFTGEMQGKGLVFQKPGTVFYGSFVGGYPEGEVLALQAITLDAPRYDYSDGNWSAGYMLGTGKIGYEYYQGTESEEPWMVIKSGEFAEDLMEGEIAYQTTNAEGIVGSWQINVAGGVTVMDERWDFQEEENTYQLISDTDSIHAFVVFGGEKESVLWKNLIPWEG